MTGVRGRRIEPVEEKPEYIKQGFPVSEKTDKELRKGICTFGKCPECECVKKCEYGAEAIRRGFFTQAEEPEQAMRPERKEYFLKQIPVAEQKQDGWQTIGEMAEAYGLNYQHMYKLLKQANVRPRAKVMTYFEHHHQHTAYYDSRDAIAQIIAHCAQVGNAKALEILTAASA